MQDDIHRLILDIFVLMQTENHKNPKSLCLTRKLQKKSPLMCGLSEIMVIPSYENDTFFFFFFEKAWEEFVGDGGWWNWVGEDVSLNEEDERIKKQRKIRKK